MAAVAGAGEGQCAAFDAAAAAFFRFVAGHRDLMQVDNRIALGADEVDMGIGVGVEALHTPNRCHTYDFPFCFEFGQIPVYRCQ